MTEREGWYHTGEEPPCVDGAKHRWLTGRAKNVGTGGRGEPLLLITTKKCKTCGLDALTKSGEEFLFSGLRM